VVDVAVRIPDGSALPRRAPVHVHAGSGEHEATLRRFGGDAPFARLELVTPVPLAPGDRLILRSAARQAVLAGAEVLDVEPARAPAAALARLTSPLGARVVAARPWASPAELAPLAGAADPEALGRSLVTDGHAMTVGPWLVAPGRLAEVRERAVAAAIAPGAEGVGVALARLASDLGLTVAQLRAALVDMHDLVVDHDRVRQAVGPGVVESADARRFVEALEAEPFTPPSPASVGVPPALVRALVRAGVVVDADGVVFSARAYADARRRIVDALEDRGALTVSDVRVVLGSTRKFVVPLLTHLDAEGVTRRRGDERIAGPRANS
jgi:selenocysteine-specific elongation factor